MAAPATSAGKTAPEIIVPRPPGGPPLIDPELMEQIIKCAADRATDRAETRLREDFEAQKLAAVKKAGATIVRYAAYGAAIGAAVGGIAAVYLSKGAQKKGDLIIGVQAGALLGGSVGVLGGKSTAEAEVSVAEV